MIKYIILLAASFVPLSADGQEKVAISFKNNYEDVYHLSLVIYTPDGKVQTRVSNVRPNEIKTYSYPVGTEIFVADPKQEEFAMKGNDLKKSGVAPFITLQQQKDKAVFDLSSIKGGEKPVQPKSNADRNPKPITKTSGIVNGNPVEKTMIQLDGNTSREDLIQTCNFLATEDVQLTFRELSIGRSFFGLLGKRRIRVAAGKLELPNGSSEQFRAGGLTPFSFVKIYYSKNIKTKASQIDMIEIED